MIRTSSKRHFVITGLTTAVVLLSAFYFLPFHKTVHDRHGNGIPPNEEVTSPPASMTSTAASQWRKLTLPEELQNVAQDDPELIRHIRENWIIPPAQERLQLRHSMTNFSQHGQPETVHRLLSNQTGGFMIECGVGDGERHSNSLYFEVNHKWNGLLIEPNPGFFNKMLTLNRHMYAINTCLSTKPSPMRVNFSFGGISGGILDLLPEKQRALRKNTKRPPQEIQCLPLYSILAAIGVTHVHYFSLDIEGAEIPVLKTLPLDEISVDVFSIEKRVLGDAEATLSKEKEIKDILAKYGYHSEGNIGFDIIMSKLSKSS